MAISDTMGFLGSGTNGSTVVDGSIGVEYGDHAYSWCILKIKLVSGSMYNTALGVPKVANEV